MNNEQNASPERELVIQPIGRPGSPGVVYHLEGLDDRPSSQQPDEFLLTAWLLLRRHQWHVAATIMLGIAIAAGVTYIQTPIYEARATLEVMSLGGPSLLGSGSESVGDFPWTTYMQTQVRVMQSHAVRQRVAERLQEELPGHVYTPRDPLEIVRRWTAPLGIKWSEISPEPVRPPLKLIVAPVEGARIIEVRAESPDPRYATTYANVMADVFLRYMLETRWENAQKTSEWMTAQLADFRQKLTRSEEALRAYMSSAGMAPVIEHANVEVQRLTQLQDELLRAAAERAARQSAFEVTRASAAESIPQVLDDGRLSGYQMNLADLRRQLAELGSLYTPEHYKMARLRAQIAELEETLRRERQTVLARIRNEYEAAVRREEILTRAYQRQLERASVQAGKEIEFAILKREVDTNRQIYEQLLQRAKVVGLSPALQMSPIRLLDGAREPRFPVRPNKVMNLAMGLFAGIAGGILLVFISSQFNRKVSLPGDIELHLKVAELGAIPSANSARDPREPKSALSIIPTRKAIGQGSVSERLELIAWQNQASAMAESYRNTLTSILAMTAGNGRTRTILISSARSGEGKSTILCNLGISLAEIGQKVLLIDGDLRQPRLHQAFDLPNSWGLTDLLRGQQPIEDLPIEALAKNVEVANLYVLPSGPLTASIANLLYSSRMEILIRRFRRDFDTILIDTPPLTLFSDARILARLADGTILVVRADHTTRDEAMAAKQRLADDGIKILGTILNGWNLRTSKRYGYHYSRYGYHLTRQNT